MRQFCTWISRYTNSFPVCVCMEVLSSPHNLLKSHNWDIVLRGSIWEINYSIHLLPEFRGHGKTREEGRRKKGWNQPYHSKTDDPALEHPLLSILLVQHVKWGLLFNTKRNEWKHEQLVHFTQCTLFNSSGGVWDKGIRKILRGKTCLTTAWEGHVSGLNREEWGQLYFHVPSWPLRYCILVYLRSLTDG